jgi:hypothetical protein
MGLPTVLLLTMVAFAIVFGVVYVARRPRVGEVAPAGVLKEKYKLTAENRPIIRLDPNRVPTELRDLIPLAEKWGISDDIIRSDVLEKASDDERRDLVEALKPRYSQINDWLATLSEQDQITEPMAAFMYLAEAAEEARSYQAP